MQIDDPADWDVAPLPRLCDLEQGAATPLVPASLAEVWGWGWGVPRNSREPELAMRLIMDIMSRDRHAAELEEFPILRVRKDTSPTWPVSRRLNEVGDQQLADGKARYVDWPKHAGEIEQIEQRIERAFRDIVIERHYRGETAADRSGGDRVAAPQVPRRVTSMKLNAVESFRESCSCSCSYSIPSDATGTRAGR